MGRATARRDDRNWSNDGLSREWAPPRTRVRRLDLVLLAVLVDFFEEVGFLREGLYRRLFYGIVRVAFEGLRVIFLTRGVVCFFLFIRRVTVSFLLLFR